MPFPTVGADLLVNGQFDDITGTIDLGNGLLRGAGTLIGWVDATGEDLDLRNQNFVPLAATSGEFWLETDGTAGNIDISQSVSGLTEDVPYQLSIDLGQELASDDNGVEIFWGGTQIAEIQAATNALETLSFTVLGGAGNGLDTLRIVGTGTPDDVGAAIDTVSLMQIATTLAATDDTLTVDEDASGPTTLNVLANDGSGPLSVVALNGQQSDVGQRVLGDQGGAFTIDATGAVSFDADGDTDGTSDFDDLGATQQRTTSVTYTVREIASVDTSALQTVQVSGEVGPVDQEAFFSVSTQEFSDNGQTEISGAITLSDVTQPTFNVLFVIDISGSTNREFAGGTVGDQNLDGLANTILDAEIASFINLRQAIDGLGFGDENVDIGLVTFQSFATIVETDAGDVTFEPSSTDLDDSLAALRALGGTNFDSALDEANNWFSQIGASADDNNILYFVSDGFPATGGTDFSNELALLDALNVQRIAIGIGADSDLVHLGVIDNTGGAEQVTTTDALDTTLLGSPLTDTDPTEVRILVDGVLTRTIPFADLVPTPFGFEIAPETVAGLTTDLNDTSVVVAEAVFNDGTVLRNTLSVQTPVAVEETATVDVTVTGVNDDPVAEAEAATVAEDDTVTIDVLDNDTDVDRDPLVIGAFTQGTNGTVTLDDNGTPDDPTDDRLIYTPAPDFNGTDSFTYTVDDGQGGTTTAVVTVTVGAINDDPVAEADTATVDEDDAVTIDVLDNDTDVDGDPLVIGAFTQGTNGTVTLDDNGTPDDPTDDRLIYTPAPDFNGTDSFTYTVDDGQGGTTSAVVTVTVGAFNDDPVVGADTATVPENGTVAIDVLDNDTDVDGDQLVIVSVNAAGTLGRVTVNNNGTPDDPTDDLINYDPNGAFDNLAEGESAIDSFTYTVSDGQGGSDTATVTVTITGVNAAPVAVDDTASVDQAETVTVDVLDNDSDPNGDAITIVSFSQGANGVVTLDNGGTPDDPTDDQLVYTPNAAFAGPTDSFTYTIDDGNGGQDTAVVTVLVIPNIPPFLPEPVVFFISENDFDVGTLVATDLDGDPVSYAISGTGDDDALFDIDSDTGLLRFVDADPSTPGNQAPDFENPTSADGDNEYDLRVTVTDGITPNTQDVRVNVTDVVDSASASPVITGDSFVFLNTHSQGAVYDFIATDADPLDVLQFQVQGPDAGVFSVNALTQQLILNAPLTDPRGSANGDAVFEIDIVVEDGNGGSATQSVDFLLLTGA